MQATGKCFSLCVLQRTTTQHFGLLRGNVTPACLCLLAVKLTGFVIGSANYQPETSDR